MIDFENLKKMFENTENFLKEKKVSQKEIVEYDFERENEKYCRHGQFIRYSGSCHFCDEEYAKRFTHHFL